MKIKLAIIFLTCCVLIGCGFHLRGQGPGNKYAGVDDVRIYIAATSEGPLLHRQLQRDLQFANAILTNDAENSDWHVIILLAKENRNAIGIDSLGRSNEYELNIEVEYLIQQVGFLKDEVRQELVARRSLYFDNSDPIGKRNEEKILLDAIRKEISGKLIKILSSKIANAKH